MVVVLIAGALASPVPAAPASFAAARDHLYAVSLLDSAQGWAVGAFGAIVHTRDGGRTWQRQGAPTTEHLYGVDFADAQQGWAVGRSGVILHTTDGGATWRPQVSPGREHLFSIHALDDQHAWAVGDWGAMHRTRDGGTTWEAQPLGRDVILNDQAWPDAQNGWVVGEAGAIFATRDGGATWTAQPAPTAKSLFAVFFRDRLTGWSAGLDGLILHTGDGGTTWVVQQGDPTVAELDQVGVRESSERPSLYDIAVVGAYGYAAGDTGAVFVSSDGGRSWQRAGAPAAANLRWIRALALVPGGGVLVGANGLTLRILDDAAIPVAQRIHAADRAD